MDELTIQADKREEIGTGAARRLRKNGFLPGNIYSGGTAATQIKFKEHEFSKALRQHHSENIIVNLEVTNEKPLQVLMKDIQHHPVSGSILHIDFQAIDMDKKIKVEMPIHLVGTPEGIAQQGGIIDFLIHAVEVECLPNDIIEQLDMDIEALKVGDRLTIGDIVIDREKYKFTLPDDVAIVAIAPPRVAEATDEEAEAEAAGAGPEVIGAKEDEEEGAAS
jgi:large subunit ribosomal protein L25